jgi:hypothetical protein
MWRAWFFFLFYYLNDRLNSANPGGIYIKARPAGLVYAASPESILFFSLPEN